MKVSVTHFLFVPDISNLGLHWAAPDRIERSVHFYRIMLGNVLGKITCESCAKANLALWRTIQMQK